MKASNVKRKVRRFAFYTVLLCLTIFTLVPLIWVIITSLKLDAEVLRTPVVYFPKNVIWDNYRYVWEKAQFSKFFFNTVLVSGITTAIVVVLSMLVAYGLSRFKFRGKKGIMNLLLLTQLLPGMMLLVPIFITLNNLRLVNTLTGLIIVFVAFDLPFCSLLLRNFANNIPVSLEEAAMIDGCSTLGVLFRIVFPLLLPGAIAVGVFSFLGSWNEFLFPLVLMSDPAKFTISIGLGYMKGAYATKYAAMAAGTVISLVIPLALFAIMQKHLINGLTSGSVKE
jgi:multiple sugar transport system permease protein